MTLRLSPRLALAALITLTAGCSGGGEETDSDTASTGSTTATTTTGAATETTGMTDTLGTSTSGTSSTSAADTTATSGTTATTGPDTGGDVMCDPKAQDCPEGFKCTAVNKMAGEYWNDNRCVPVMGDAGLGDPCTIADLNDPGNGIDDCGVGFICLNFDDMGKGYCTEFCNMNDECASGKGVCDPAVNEGLLPICFATCDPLLQDCIAGQGCYGDPMSPDFICFGPDPGESTGMEDDFCEYTNQCLAGFHCIESKLGVDCDPMALGCCTPFCDLTDQNPPCDMGEECVPFYMDPPPQHMNVGVCAIPQ